jgi:hypothetical protein
MEKSHKFCLEVGDQAFACYSSYLLVSSLFQNKILKVAFDEGKYYIDFLRNCNYKFFFHFLIIR